MNLANTWALSKLSVSYFTVMMVVKEMNSRFHP